MIALHCKYLIYRLEFFSTLSYTRYGKMLMQFATIYIWHSPFFPSFPSTFSQFPSMDLENWANIHVAHTYMKAFYLCLCPSLVLSTTSDCRALFMRKSFRLQSKRFDCIFYGGGCMFNSKAPCRHLTYIMPVQGLTSQKILDVREGMTKQAAVSKSRNQHFLWDINRITVCEFPQQILLIKTITI